MNKKYLLVDIETTGLDPLVNEITCIGFLVTKSKNSQQFVNDIKGDIITTMTDGNTEEAILEKFWDYIDKSTPDFLVGWNIDNFDWKFLKIRSLINGVKISKYYKKKERIDLMVLLKTPKWQSLNTYSKILFNEQKMQVNPIDLFRENKFEELIKYNNWDLELTRMIFDKCVSCGVIVEDDDKN